MNCLSRIYREQFVIVGGHDSVSLPLIFWCSTRIHFRNPFIFIISISYPILNFDDMIKLRILPFVYHWSPADSYRLVLMNISNLSLLFGPILHANRVMETLC